MTTSNTNTPQTPNAPAFPLLPDFSKAELAVLLQPLGLKLYQTESVYAWLHKGVCLADMSDLPKSLRAALAAAYLDRGAEIVKSVKSADPGDETEKFLMRLACGNVVESVLMRYSYGSTVCLSTQVGCRMGCTFCASTIGGLVRNLSAGEILAQAVEINRYLGGGIGDARKITNVVLMGSGEPLDNYENVVKFLRLISAEGGLNISPRNISLSTCGLPDKMRALAAENLPVNLTISLHAPAQAQRESLMPIARANPLTEVISAAKYYFKTTGRRVIFEYTLVSGVNDSVADAKKLAALLAGFPTHINLIRLNPVAERSARPSPPLRTKEFLQTLTSLGASATLRRQLGKDIDGACGQLRNKFVGDK